MKSRLHFVFIPLIIKQFQTPSDIDLFRSCPIALPFRPHKVVLPLVLDALLATFGVTSIRGAKAHKKMLGKETGRWDVFWQRCCAVKLLQWRSGCSMCACQAPCHPVIVHTSKSAHIPIVVLRSAARSAQYLCTLLCLSNDKSVVCRFFTSSAWWRLSLLFASSLARGFLTITGDASQRKVLKGAARSEEPAPSVVEDSPDV